MRRHDLHARLHGQLQDARQALQPLIVGMRPLPAAIPAMQPTTEEDGREAHQPTELALGIAGGPFGAHGGDTRIGELIPDQRGGTSRCRSLDCSQRVLMRPRSRKDGRSRLHQ